MKGRPLLGGDCLPDDDQPGHAAASMKGRPIKSGDLDNAASPNLLIKPQ